MPTYVDKSQLAFSKLRAQPYNLLGYIRPTPFRRHVGIIPRPISATLGISHHTRDIYGGEPIEDLQSQEHIFCLPS
jgi:hypothetical protein